MQQAILWKLRTFGVFIYFIFYYTSGVDENQLCGLNIDEISFQ